MLNIIDIKQFKNFKELYLTILLSNPADNVRLTTISCLPIIGFEVRHNNLKVPIKLFKEKEELLNKFFGC